MRSSCVEDEAYIVPRGKTRPSARDEASGCAVTASPQRGGRRGGAHKRGGTRAGSYEESTTRPHTRRLYIQEQERTGPLMSGVKREDRSAADACIGGIHSITGTGKWR